MGTVSLETFVIWKHKEGKDGLSAKDIFPEPRKVRKTAGQTAIVLGDIPLPPGLPHPSKGITMLYGFRDALDALHGERTRASKEGLQMRTITTQVDVGDIVMGSINEEVLKRSQFVSLKRMSMDLQQIVIDRVNAMARKEAEKRSAANEKNTKDTKADKTTKAGKTSKKSSKSGGWKPHVDFTSIIEAGSRPDLICKAVRQAPFSHLTVVVYHVPVVGAPRGRQVATLFTNKVKSISVRGDPPPFEIELPKMD